MRASTRSTTRQRLAIATPAPARKRREAALPFSMAKRKSLVDKAV